MNKPVYCHIHTQRGDREYSYEGWLVLNNEGEYLIQPSKCYYPDGIHIPVNMHEMTMIYPEAITTDEMYSQALP
jgi:hypothetical protein